MSVSRRKFINTIGMTIPGLVFAGTLPKYLSGLNADAKIDSVSLYLVNVKKARNFSHSTWHNRQHIFVKIQALH